MASAGLTAGRIGRESGRGRMDCGSVDGRGSCGSDGFGVTGCGLMGCGSGGVGRTGCGRMNCGSGVFAAGCGDEDSGCGNPKNKFGISAGGWDADCVRPAAFCRVKNNGAMTLSGSSNSMLSWTDAAGGAGLIKESQIPPGENYASAFQRRLNQVHRQQNLGISQV